jgi:2',3'-cyclic-nucleotide 2'-phosphodiesterase (5'-nucleotidase family)
VVIGYTTTGTPGVLPGITDPFEFRAGAAGIRAALDESRRAGAQFTIVVAHAGGECDGDRCTGEMVDLARQLEPGAVDLIVGGHNHSPGFGVVNGIPIVRAGSEGQAITVADLTRAPKGKVSFATRVDTAFADRVTPDAEVVAALASYVREAEAIGGRPVGTSAERLGIADRRLGWLIADAMRLVTDSHVAIATRNEIRTDLPEGPVSFESLYAILSSENELWQFPLSGRQLRTVIETAVAEASPHMLSGVTLSYDPSRAPGNRTVSLTLADGRPVVDDSTYLLVTRDIVGLGSRGYTILRNMVPRRLGITQLDAFVRYVEDLPQPFAAPRDERARQASSM